MVWFDFAEGRDIVDDAVYPHGFDVGDVVAFDLIGDVVVVSFVHLFLSQYFCLEFFLIAVGKTFHLFYGLVEQHLTIYYLLFLAC